MGMVASWCVRTGSCDVGALQGRYLRQGPFPDGVWWMILTRDISFRSSQLTMMEPASFRCWGRANLDLEEKWQSRCGISYHKNNNNCSKRDARCGLSIAPKWIRLKLTLGHCTKNSHLTVRGYGCSIAKLATFGSGIICSKSGCAISEDYTTCSR